MEFTHRTSKQKKNDIEICRKGKWIDLCYYFSNTRARVFVCDKWVTNLKYTKEKNDNQSGSQWIGRKWNEERESAKKRPAPIYWFHYCSVCYIELCIRFMFALRGRKREREREKDRAYFPALRPLFISLSFSSFGCCHFKVFTGLHMHTFAHIYHFIGYTGKNGNHCVSFVWRGGPASEKMHTHTHTKRTRASVQWKKVCWKQKTHKQRTKQYYRINISK